MLIRQRTAIIAGALVASALAVRLILASTSDDNAVRTAVLTLVVSWSFLGAGLVALVRYGRRFGALMCAVGLAAFLVALGDAEASLPFTAGLVFGSLWIGILVHALAAFPTGRLPTRSSVVTVAAAYAVVTLGQLAVVLFDDLSASCPKCPDNAALIVNDPGISAALEIAVSTVGTVIGLAVVVELARRWRSASPPLRRALLPVLWTGVAGFASIALLYASYVVAPGASQIGSWIALALLVAFPFAFLAGLLRMRLARAAVGGLVVELGEEPSERDLRDALRRALHDPDLAIAYWRDETSAFVDGCGQPVALPGDGDAKAASVIERDGAPVAALIHDAYLSLDPELLEAVAAAAGLALENARLQAALRARMEDLRTSRARLVEAHAAERRRLERNLHDGAQQRLVGLGLELALAEARAEADPLGTREILNRARGELIQAMNELREIARGIHPAVLTDRGIAAALDALVARMPLPVTLELRLGAVRLPDAIEVAAYYVIAEALTNVVKHAGARTASVRVAGVDRVVVVEVGDDGAGGADAALGSGLRGLRERVEALDGRLEVRSPPGGGTRIRAKFPMAPPLIPLGRAGVEPAHGGL